MIECLVKAYLAQRLAYGSISLEPAETRPRSNFPESRNQFFQGMIQGTLNPWAPKVEISWTILPYVARRFLTAVAAIRGWTNWRFLGIKSFVRKSRRLIFPKFLRFYRVDFVLWSRRFLEIISHYGLLFFDGFALPRPVDCFWERRAEVSPTISRLEGLPQSCLGSSRMTETKITVFGERM